MSLDTHLWEALQAHGVTEAHLDMLLRALDLHRNGSLTWHFGQGQLSQCDLRVVMPSKWADMQRVSDALLDGGNSLLR
jgi:hypothetical protein